MNSMNPDHAVGLKVRSIDMLGAREDPGGNFVAAEAVLEVGDNRRTHGKFTLELITKDQFVSNELKAAMDLEPKDVLLAEEVEMKPPYVLNDRAITPEILREKFLGRVIKKDLAVSLWEITEDTK